jgi:hypothetical protein
MPSQGFHSPLGNPFVIGRDADREQVIRKYREFLKTSIQNGAKIKTEFERVEELNKKGDVVVIFCWCAPSKCHCDIIKELIEGKAGLLRDDEKHRLIVIGRALTGKIR